MQIPKDTSMEQLEAKHDSMYVSSTSSKEEMTGGSQSANLNNSIQDNNPKTVVFNVPKPVIASESKRNAIHIAKQDDERTTRNCKIVEKSPKGRYLRFNDLLGEGSFKKVFRANDSKNNTDVAWNSVKFSALKGEGGKRILQEMKILQQLDHPNIIKFYGSWIMKETQTVVFITEFISGGTLAEYMQSRTIRLSTIKRWCKSILHALSYLHGQETPIIHRDLKCENIFVMLDSGDIRIGDLGLASWERQGDAKSCLGTPEYMAPELYNEQYDEQVDVYAFGMCVLEMITKLSPYWELKNTFHIMRQVTEGIPPCSFTDLSCGLYKDFIGSCILNPKDNPDSRRPSVSVLLNSPFLSMADTDDCTVMDCTNLLKPESNTKKEVRAHELTHQVGGSVNKPIREKLVIPNSPKKLQGEIKPNKSIISKSGASSNTPRIKHAVTFGVPSCTSMTENANERNEVNKEQLMNDRKNIKVHMNCSTNGVNNTCVSNMVSEQVDGKLSIVGTAHRVTCRNSSNGDGSTSTFGSADSKSTKLVKAERESHQLAPKPGAVSNCSSTDGESIPIQKPKQAQPSPRRKSLNPTSIQSSSGSEMRSPIARRHSNPANCPSKPDKPTSSAAHGKHTIPALNNTKIKTTTVGEEKLSNATIKHRHCTKQLQKKPSHWCLNAIGKGSQTVIDVILTASRDGKRTEIKFEYNLKTEAPHDTAVELVKSVGFPIEEVDAIEKELVNYTKKFALSESKTNIFTTCKEAAVLNDVQIPQKPEKMANFVPSTHDKKIASVNGNSAKSPVYSSGKTISQETRGNIEKNGESTKPITRIKQLMANKRYDQVLLQTRPDLKPEQYQTLIEKENDKHRKIVEEQQKNILFLKMKLQRHQEELNKRIAYGVGVAKAAAAVATEINTLMLVAKQKTKRKNSLSRHSSASSTTSSISIAGSVCSQYSTKDKAKQRQEAKEKSQAEKIKMRQKQKEEAEGLEAKVLHQISKEGNTLSLKEQKSSQIMTELQRLNSANAAPSLPMQAKTALNHALSQNKRVSVDLTNTSNVFTPNTALSPPTMQFAKLGNGSDPNITFVTSPHQRQSFGFSCDGIPVHKKSLSHIQVQRGSFHVQPPFSPPILSGKQIPSNINPAAFDFHGANPSVIGSRVV